jgi:hypothetical protein
MVVAKVFVLCGRVVVVVVRSLIACAYNAYIALHTGVYTTFLVRAKSISLVSNIEIV